MIEGFFVNDQRIFYCEFREKVRGGIVFIAWRGYVGSRRGWGWTVCRALSKLVVIIYLVIHCRGSWDAGVSGAM